MSQVIKIDPGAVAKAEWIERRDELLELTKAVQAVESDDQLKEAGRLQTAAKKHLSELEKVRKAVKQPAIDVGKQIDAQAKELRAELEAEAERVRKLNGKYATKLAAEAEAERQRIAAEEASKAEQAESAPTFGGVALEPMPIAPPPEMPTGKVHTGANAMVEVWDFDVVDPTKVPREFLSVDEVKIRAHVAYCKKMKQAPEVAGVRFSKRVDVRSR